MPAGAVDKQEAKLDADDCYRQQETGPVELFQLGGQPIFGRKEEDCHQGDPKRDQVGHNQRDRKVDIRRCALGAEVVERTGGNRKGD